jgi:protoheme IX farnesyltransferase
MKLRTYYAALKPERTYANVMTTGAGFLFASRWHVQGILLLATIIGTTFIVMSACAVNNCIDRELDARMPRTKRRATATGEVRILILAVLAAVLGIAGFMILAIRVNMLTVLLGIIGYVDYVLLYSWSKRKTPWSTLLGTISGAVPLMAGYTAVTGHLNVTVLLLGLTMVFWQMPHFYAIGIFRHKDYAAGNLPVWPVRHGLRSAQWWILIYAALYLAAVLLVASVGSAGLIFAIVVGLAAVYWLWIGTKGFSSTEPEKWARSMFGFSLLAILILCAGVAFSPLLAYNIGMLILTHVIIATLGLVQALYGLFSPSRRNLRITYGLTAATFVTGTYLVWHLHTNIMQSCISGLTYLSIILAATVVTHRRLAKQTNN